LTNANLFDRDGAAAAPLIEPHMNVMQTGANSNLPSANIGHPAASTSENIQADQSQPATSATSSTKKRKQVDEGEQPAKKTKHQDEKAQEEPPKVGPSSQAPLLAANILNRGLEVDRPDVVPCFASLPRGESR
jgi:hypothetical protein